MGYKTETTYSTPSSTTAGPVTTGATGIAAFDCNSTISSDTYTTPSGSTFREECYTNYAYYVWNSTTNSSSTTTEIKVITITTVYSFESCMKACAQNNDARSATDDQTCRAVTYYASLTATVAAGTAGNCWLKDAGGARGDSDSTINYSLASAYMLDS